MLAQHVTFIIFTLAFYFSSGNSICKRKTSIMAHFTYPVAATFGGAANYVGTKKPTGLHAT